jgi:hypothetical protein
MASFWHGLCLVILAFVICFFSLFALVGSKLLPQFDEPLLRAVQADDYYALLFPMSLLTLFVTVYASWLGLKIFRSA